jgi:release factor glutamine methyltransferase
MGAVEAGWTIEALLRESGLPRPEAEILLRSALGLERAHLIAHREEAVDLSRLSTARAWFARRRSGEPIAYITGSREFYGLALRVTPKVLIPRPETEQLVDLALRRLPSGSSKRVLELGTGSGAISIALASLKPESEITATDISEAALEVARGNARAHGVKIDFVLSDWFEAIGPRPFDLIVSNPPYVAAGDPHLEQGDLPFEPRLALLGGDDGLACIRKIAAGARERLGPGACLLMEHGYDQRERCVALLRDLGYSEVGDFPDLAGLPRVCAAAWHG